MKKQTKDFINTLKKLEPVEFIGVARILKIPVARPVDVPSDTPDAAPVTKAEARDFYEIFADMINKFDSLGRAQRRQIMEVMRDATRS